MEDISGGRLPEGKMDELVQKYHYKGIQSPASHPLPLLLTDASSLLKLLAIERRHPLGKRHEEMEEVKNMSTNGNVKPPHVLISK